MFKITTDSSCDSFKKDLNENDISCISLIYSINGKDYEDESSNDSDYEDFYKLLDNGAVPTTSQINAYRHYQLFIEILKNNPDTPILHLSLSSGLSGTYERALEGAALAKEEYPNARIYVLDTLSVSQGHNLILKKAIELRNNNIDIDEAYKILVDHSIRCHHWMLIDDLKHLKRGGRISNTAAIIGTAFHIKPLITLDRLGKLKIVQKIRGTLKGVSTLVNKLEEYIENKMNLEVVIANANNFPLCNKIKELILSKYPNAKVEIAWIGPVIGSHVGKGTVGIGFFGKPRTE